MKIPRASGTPGSAKRWSFPVQAVLCARVRLHAIFDVAEVKSVGRYFPNLWRSVLDVAQDPETGVPDWLHYGFPLGIESLLGRTICFLKSTLPVRPW